jgi:hypothetical protein
MRKPTWAPSDAFGYPAIAARPVAVLAVGDIWDPVEAASGKRRARPSPTTIAVSIPSNRASAMEVGRLRERIALRLGPNAELTRTYATAVDACHAFFEVWGDRWSGGTYARLRAVCGVQD